MKKASRKSFCTAICFLAAFAAWTMLVRFVDVRAIGPGGSSVGFAVLNEFVHSFTGVHMILYTVTDWLMLVPAATAFGFAVLGLVQLFRRKSLLQVDRSILVLGGFYFILMLVYIIFEIAVVNYRPVLIEGIPEASYPSSTTLLVLCVMPTAVMQLNGRIGNRVIKRCISAAIVTFTAFMVIARFVSGVHWITDIIGGILLSAGLVAGYHSAVIYTCEKNDAKI